MGFPSNRLPPPRCLSRAPWSSPQLPRGSGRSQAEAQHRDPAGTAPGAGSEPAEEWHGVGGLTPEVQAGPAEVN